MVTKLDEMPEVLSKVDKYGDNKREDLAAAKKARDDFINLIQAGFDPETVTGPLEVTMNHELGHLLEISAAFGGTRLVRRGFGPYLSCLEEVRGTSVQILTDQLGEISSDEVSALITAKKLKKLYGENPDAAEVEKAGDLLGKGFSSLCNGTESGEVHPAGHDRIEATFFSNPELRVAFGCQKPPPPERAHCSLDGKKTFLGTSSIQPAAG